MKLKAKSVLIGMVLTAVQSALAQQITVIVNRDPVTFPDQGPMMSNGRVLVPLRGVLEKMGAHVMWDPSTQTVTAHREGTDVKLTIAENTASVNGHPVNLDVPAQIIHGSTMVPLRFVGEALGENVHWDSQSNTVDIEQGDDYKIPGRDRDLPRPEGSDQRPPMRDDRGPDRPRPGQQMVLPAGAIIPVTLDTILDSGENNRGDQFTTHVTDSSGFPNGTMIDGVVEGAKSRHGDEGGVLELRFTSIDFPDGRKVPIDGSLIGLDNKSIEHRRNMLFAKPSDNNQRGAFAGYGAGAGLVIGLATHRPIEDTAIGGLLGLAAGSLDRSRPSDVHLKPGTKFGVHLRSQVAITR